MPNTFWLCFQSATGLDLAIPLLSNTLPDMGNKPTQRQSLQLGLW